MNFRGFRPTAEGRHTGLEQLKLVIFNFHLIPFLTAVGYSVPALHECCQNGGTLAVALILSSLAVI